MQKFDQDPTAWANKRRAAMERAKQIREARKSGGDTTDEHTFQPTTNKRPSYLDKRPVDTLDVVTANSRDPNDIFEKPLPGAANYNLPSPGSDALGKEVKKFGHSDGFNAAPPPAKLTRDQQLEAMEANYQSKQRGGGMQNGAYKSKFMQQYEQRDNIPSQSQNQNVINAGQLNNIPQQNPIEQDDTDDVFFSSLRGGDSRRDSGPGWNNDTSMEAGFGGFPAAKSKSGLKPARKRGEPNPPRRPPVGSNNTSPNRPTWNNDTDVAYGQQQQQGNIPSRRADPRAALGGGGKGGRPEWESASVQYSEDFENDDGDDDDDEPIDPNFSGSGSYSKQFEQQFKREYVSQMRGFDEPQESLVSPQIRSGGMNARGGKPQDVAKARSRLGLLKSKIRASDETVNTQSSYNNNNNYDNNNNGKTLMRSSSSQQMETVSSQKSSNSHNNKPSDRDASNAGLYSDPNDFSFASLAALDGNNYVASPTKKSAPPPRNNSAPPRRQAPSVPEKRREQQQQQYKSSTHQQVDYNMGTPPSKPSGGTSGGYDLDAAMAAEEARLAQSNSDLTPCPHCERKFNPTAYQRHIKICKKVFIDKRPEFDSSKQRVVDADQLKLKQEADRKERRDKKQGRRPGGGSSSGYGNQNVRAAAPSSSSGSVPKWKEDSLKFRQAMKAARQVTDAIATGKPLPPPTISEPDPSFIPCPHCGRRFNQKAGERHIPQCKNIRAKPKSLKKGAGGMGLKGGAQTLNNVKGRKW